jgi:hypothetical protein
VRVIGDYFDDRMVNRQRLIWTIATRRQLERWEPLVAESVRRHFANRQLDGVDIWTAATEHHFALVAARNLFRALDLPPANISVDPMVRDELIEGRDLHEHWPDNLPVFNVTPRQVQPPYPSGQRFAARNPKSGPYWWLGWGNKTGARLLPNVSAPALHELLDAVEADVLSQDAALARFVPPRAPSPWIYEKGEWWPKPDDA